MPRRDDRRADELRPVRFTRGFARHAHGSALTHAGDTVVLCTACWEKSVPTWRVGSGAGWITAEYDMLPASTTSRRPRNRHRIDGRTQEIQRLIGRSLRAVVDLARMGENCIFIDCDVLQADGGTRTASITGAFVALADAVTFALRNEWITESPIREAVAAVSVGKVNRRLLLDLDYAEDADAEVDMNVVMTASGRFVEVQGTGESAAFTRAEMDRLVTLASRGIRRLLNLQAEALRRRSPR